MKPNSPPKLILFHPSIHKQGAAGPLPHRLWILALLSFFTFVFALTHFTMKDTPASTTTASSAAAARLPAHIIEALVHYAASNSSKMPAQDLRLISDLLTGLHPCNLLVFGLNFESLLWRSLNHRGRTVFIDENSYLVSKFEEQHPGVEAYDVQFTTKVSQMQELLDSARDQIAGECRPVQNLLFSDCRLGINDLPNELYEVGWDVILVDGPSGYRQSAPGRMAAIFTAGVMARSKKEKKGTHVFVHDFDREVERVFSEEFLCRENMVDSGSSGSATMAHFVVDSMKHKTTAFCKNTTTSSSSSSPS